MTRILLRGGCVLTLGARSPNLRRGDVLIEDDVVTEVGSGLRARDAEPVDATDTIVMPGFVDTHRHAWRSLSRNVGAWPPGSGTGEAGDSFRPEDVYAATLIGLLGAIEAGITTVVDWSPIRPDDALVESALRAQAH
jgi:5-methylthioadenosine/S-adenosylhomocysteine deaminase